MEAIAIGSTIIGKSGKRFIVDRVEGDIIYSGALKIRSSAVVSVELPSLIDHLLFIASLGKQDAIDKLTFILSDFSVNDIYESSLDLETFLGTFIRRLLADIHPSEFAEIGKDGSEGKYGVWTPTDSPLTIPAPGSGVFPTGCRVTHTDLYHCYGADVGTITLIDSFGDYHVRWGSDGHIGRYSMDSLKPTEVP